METMTLETLRIYLSDMEPEDVAVINAALFAAIRERDELRSRLDSALGDRITEFRRANDESGRADKAESELAAINRYWEQRAKKAEAELAALKKRIADSTDGFPQDCLRIHPGIPCVVVERELVGRHVRLLVEDDNV